MQQVSQPEVTSAFGLSGHRPNSCWLDPVANDLKPKIGEHKVVRYLVGPPGGQNQDTRWWTFAFWAPSKSFLQEELVRDLDPRTYQGGDDVVFDFSIGVRHAGQSFLAQNQLYDCEYMVFNPWNCLPEHMLGSVNRMRLAVYLASRQARRTLNMVAS